MLKLVLKEMTIKSCSFNDNNQYLYVSDRNLFSVSMGFKGDRKLDWRQMPESLQTSSFVRCGFKCELEYPVLLKYMYTICLIMSNSVF